MRVRGCVVRECAGSGVRGLRRAREGLRAAWCACVTSSDSAIAASDDALRATWCAVVTYGCFQRMDAWTPRECIRVEQAGYLGSFIGLDAAGAHAHEGTRGCLLQRVLPRA